MKLNIFHLLILMSLSQLSISQEDGFYLSLSSDTILAGNVLQISFVANNVAGQFEAPDFEGLNIISGPNTSSSMSMVNGTVSQRASYSYTLYLEDIGEYILPPAFLVTNEETLETEPTSIIVLPNPDGIIDQPASQSGFFQFNFPNTPPKKKEYKKEKKPIKKKRKLKKI